MKIIKVKEQNKLIKTSDFNLGKFSFDNFNPVQSRAFEFYNKDCNALIASETSSGKTVVAELFIANEARERKGKSIYLAPLRALSQEKYDDWQSENHHFSDLKVSICTGDFKLTPSRQAEIEEADVIIMTPEALNCKVRNPSESNYFLKNVGTLIVDEVHGLDDEGRGVHLESALMKFSQLSPDARLIGLSATLPNVDDLGNWFSLLNGKDSYVLESSYRPCKLNVHYTRYEEGYGYDDNENIKINNAVRILNKHPEDKFIIFVHGKKTGALLKARLDQLGIGCDYHNADVPKAKRNAIEKKFREDKNFRVVIGTSTLSAGLNFPARRVIVLGVHRGLSEVKVNEIRQEMGRSGRPQYDKEGDAYTLIPHKTYERHVERLQNPEPIHSQMLDNKCLAFHLVSEIHHNNIKNIDEVHEWYNRSLAAYQNKSLDEDVAEEVIKALSRCNAIRVENDVYQATTTGVISSMFYYSPFDVADLGKNFAKVFEKNQEKNDYWISMALGNVDSYKFGIVSNSDREVMTRYQKGLIENFVEQNLGGFKGFTESAIKYGCCYYNLLKGNHNNTMVSIMRNLQMDSERLVEVLATYNNMVGKWIGKDYFKKLSLRLMYGVSEELLELCQIPNVGKAKSQKLFDYGLKDLKAVSENVLGIMKALNCSKNVAETVAKNAGDLL